MKRLKKIILILILAVFLILVISNFSFAQRKLEISYPEVSGIRPEGTTIGLPTYVKYIFNFSLGLAGLVAFIVLVYAGFRYLTSAGDPTKKRDAKNQIFAAFLGLAVLVFSYLILTTINPQLVFLRVPERVYFPKEAPIKPEAKEKDILSYTEIPIGGLIGGLFSKERMDKIKDISENVKEISEDIFSKAGELNSLVDQCGCSLTSAQCAGDCSGGFCSGDPCPVRNEINKKREEIQKYISDQEFEIDSKEFGKPKIKLKGLGYWQKKIDKEINGSSEEKYIGFRKIYEDLKSAEELIKNCSLSLSKKGEAQTLLGYNEFWQYRERLEEDNEIKGVEPEYPFDYISPDSPYYLANFYCAEVFYEISTEPIHIEEMEIPLGLEERGKTFCESEILIGETLDNAEELARRMLVELDNINNNALAELAAAKNLINLSNPENCIASNCYTECTWVEKMCWIEEPCPVPEAFDFWGWIQDMIQQGFHPEPILPIWEPFSPFVFAQGGCGYWEDCSYCDVPPCSGSLCPGDLALRGQINNQFSEIQNNNSQIFSSQEKLKNLIEEKEVEDKLKKSEIFKNLEIAQKQLGPCYTSSEIQRKALSGEKVLWRGLYSCSGLKEFAQAGTPFYNEEGEEINECYGPSQGEPDLFDNFFCCYYEIFW